MNTAGTGGCDRSRLGRNSLAPMPTLNFYFCLFFRSAQRSFIISEIRFRAAEDMV